MVAEVFNTSKWSIYSKQDQPKQATWVYSYGKNELPNFSQSLADTGYRVTHYSAKSVEIRLDSIEKICGKVKFKKGIECNCSFSFTLTFFQK